MYASLSLTSLALLASKIVPILGTGSPVFFYGPYNYVSCQPTADLPLEDRNAANFTGNAFSVMMDSNVSPGTLGPMTPQNCMSLCSTSYPWIAVMGSQCACSTSFNSSLAADPSQDGMCSTPCPGDAAMTCGSIADGRWSLFHAVDYRDPSTLTPSSSAKPTFAITNSTSTSAAGYMTSTFYSTKVLTITSCAAAVTDCPARLSTTSYPVSTSVYPVATSTVYATKVFTVTSCAAAVVNCPARVGTTSYPVSTTVYPVGCMNCTMPKPAVAISPAGPVNATTAVSKSTNAAVLGSTVPSNTPKPTAAATNTVSSVPYKGLATTVNANSFGLLVTLVGVIALF